MSKHLVTIAKKGLLVEAQDNPPLEPYAPLKKAPPKFPYGEYAILPPDDARKIRGTLEALNDRARRIESIEEVAKEMRVETEQKVQEYKGTEGYESIQQEMNVLKEKLAGDVEGTLDRVGKALIEHNDVVITVYEQVTAGKAGKADVQNALVEAIKKYASPKVAGKIIEEADASIKALEEANTKIKRRLASWPSPQDLRKKVKQELPKGGSKKTADVWESIKGFFSQAAEFIGGIVRNIGDKLSGLVSSVQQSDSLVEEMKTLLGQLTVGASKEKKADYRGSSEIFENRHQYADAMVDAFGGEDSVEGLRALFDDLVSAMSDSEAFANFDHIARMRDIDFSGEEFEHLRNDTEASKVKADKGQLSKTILQNLENVPESVLERYPSLAGLDHTTLSELDDDELGVLDSEVSSALKESDLEYEQNYIK